MKKTLTLWVLAAAVMVRSWCLDLIEWLTDSAEPEPAHRVTARRLTQEWEDALPDGHGEAKRHQVLAALIKAHPTVSLRELSQVIEDELP